MYHTFWCVTHCPVILSDLFKPHLQVCILQGILSSETKQTKFSVSDVLHTTVRCLHLSRKHLTTAVHINCAPVIFSSPALHGYATLRVFRCIIRVSWDLIKITASEIPFKWKCSQKTMADTSSYRLFLFSAHQQGKANPCFHDGRQEGHKLCCFLTLLMLFLSEQPNN